ncbi:23S rRNA (guanosine2251-2'-O)-methyltransferase [Cetobacterium ceti]|uniref:23S rRNA (Guanosine2251-2'-O)-methyltransferase n=1 Tax=Cetobacterium ceti TaxID=180163 RepID=A0A1T4PQN3_9FUSO|nr:23S rRNA (guanosine(2251)-2'-O)-methyltransferase RlmB [Cetobacterium ceti]SJZ93198.1 23S rRNA (guanosine2251-2'-O)-methyltransferase [Cetobacterium ceti]
MEKVIGINPVIELLQNKEKTIEKIEIFKGLKEEKLGKLKRLAAARNVKLFHTTNKVENSQGIVAYITEYDYYMDFGAFLEKIARDEKGIVLILDGVQDPRNFGALIRSAEIFGVQGIIIPERNSVKINETVIKTSTGAIEHMDIVKVTNISEAISQLKKLDYWVYGAEGEERAKNYYDEKYPLKSALVLGSEGEGIRKKVKENCDFLVKIPMHGKINSLNVSVAGGIILSEIAKSIY